MPKKLDYPQASFDKALKLAEAVHSLGGNCSQEIAGKKLGQTGTGGGFRTLVGATVKFNLIKTDKGSLYTTELFKEINLSYNQAEKLHYLRNSFLTPPIFRQLYEKLNGRELPIEILDKILAKEYDVDEASALRVSKYFHSGAKLVQLIDEKNILIPSNNLETELQVIEEEPVNETVPAVQNVQQNFNNVQVVTSDSYIVQIIGPGLNTRLEINEIEDIKIVDVVLNKIKKKFTNGSE